MAGFGMGFLAFALKKLLLPVFIGAQIFKSVLIALFLPSLLGSVGKFLGKGLSTFSGASGASQGLGGLGGLAGLGGLGGLGHGNDQVEDFEFKDTSPYTNDDGTIDANAEGSNTLTLNLATSSTETPAAMNR